jgi:hypothetical protein
LSLWATSVSQLSFVTTVAIEAEVLSLWVGGQYPPAPFENDGRRRAVP